MYKIGFVVLNYNTYNDTMDFIKSVQEYINNDYEIVIVDNKSPDKSGILLKNNLINEKNITVILNDDNYGFSKGNNIGIKYAIEKLKCDFIVMTNSDTCILDNNFCSNMISEYELSNAAIIGPEINNPNGNYQLPIEPEIAINISKLKKELLKFKIHYILNKIGLDMYFDKRKKKKQIINIKQERKENVILHGSCIIFTPSYFKSNIIGIPEKTNFYREEEFIYLYAIKNNMKIVYNPEIKILHKRNSAIINTYKKYRKKKEFEYTNHINSTKTLIKEVKNYLNKV